MSASVLHECTEPSCHACYKAGRGFWRDHKAKPPRADRSLAARREQVFTYAALFLAGGGILAMMTGQAIMECVVLELAGIVAAVLSR